MTSLKKSLAYLASVLALLAAVVDIPGQDDYKLREIASLMESEKDHVAPRELAEQIHSGRKIRLIDLRDSVSYIRQHILNSELMSVRQLLDSRIRRNETVVLYSEGGTHASQAWILLKVNGYDSVFTLLGGYSGWKEDILNPVLHAGATAVEIKDFERRKVLSRFFRGEPMIVSKDTSRKKFIPRNRSPKGSTTPARPRKDRGLRYEC